MREQDHARSAETPLEDSLGEVRLLLVEDNPADVELFRQILRESAAMSFTVESAATLGDAKDRLLESPPDLVVLDLSLPDSEGLETLQQLRAGGSDVPVVVMTGNEDEALALRVLRAGAHGYLVKGEAGAALLARTLWHALERHRLGRKLEVAREREEQLATQDPVTGLPNRVLFTDRLAQAVGAGKGQTKLGVLVADLDRLRRINDRFSYGDGDDVLRRVTGRLRSCLRSSETLARIGGDEFGVVLYGIGREIDAARVAERMLDALLEPIPVRGHPCVITASLGIAICPNDGKNPEDLVSRAEVALYHAKRRGGHRYEFYSPDLNSTASERLDLEHDLRRALEEDQLVAYFQPKVDAARRRIAGVEALVRWRHPERGLIPPGKFISVAEEAGLIDALGDWVLRTACRQGRIWQDQGLPSLPVAVNVSARQFENGDFPSRLRAALEESGLAPAALELEVTESTLMSDLQQVGEVLGFLKETGVRLAIDDFGTGYSSLAVLRALPVDCLKIDRSFIRRIADDELDARLVEAIVTLAHGLGRETVAEGVETAEQADFLCSIGCRSLQGFLFAQPVPAEDLEPMLRAPDVSWQKSAE